MVDTPLNNGNFIAIKNYKKMIEFFQNYFLPFDDHNKIPRSGHQKL